MVWRSAADGRVRNQELLVRLRVVEQCPFHTVSRIRQFARSSARRGHSAENLHAGLGQAMSQALGVHTDPSQVLRQIADAGAVRALVSACLPVVER
ncbi:hypothetical protein ACIGDI_39860 [Streptomyces sp. NPDC085900]|uniref:hypothetical protein n=1 Tax=Streptomyces sp. NPDC085900 TaxID=3365737 RepID=UPI0037D033D0